MEVKGRDPVLLPTRSAEKQTGQVGVAVCLNNSPDENMYFTMVSRGAIPPQISRTVEEKAKMHGFWDQYLAKLWGGQR